MEGKQVTAEEKPFSLERAEEDDEFEEFERDGEERAVGVKVKSSVYNAVSCLLPIVH